MLANQTRLYQMTWFEKQNQDACYQPPKYLFCDNIRNATIFIWLDIISELSMWGILMESIIVQYQLNVPDSAACMPTLYMLFQCSVLVHI